MPEPLNPSQAPPEQEETVTLTLPQSTFDMAKEFVSALGQIMSAADAKLKADRKGQAAGDTLQGLFPEQASGLEGFQDELSSASNAMNGLPAKIPF